MGWTSYSLLNKKIKQRRNVLKLSLLSLLITLFLPILNIHDRSIWIYEIELAYAINLNIYMY